MTNKVSTNARFKESSFNKGKIIAEKQNRSFNNLIEFLLDECIKAYEKENGVISLGNSEEQ